MSDIGKPFKFDAAAWLATRDQSKPVSIAPIETDELMGTARKRIASLLEGELPDEVAKQVQIRAAETAGQKGIGGQMARNLTFRDLGASSMDAISAGITASHQQENLRLEREKTNRMMELEASKLNEEIRQANDRFAAAMVDSDLKAATVSLEAIKLQSMNKQFRISEENRLIMSNSQMAIPGLQQNMDSLGGAFLELNQALQKFASI